MVFLNEHSAQASQPKRITTPLYSHQLAVLQRANELEQGKASTSLWESIQTDIACICTPPGYGKTLMGISLCCAEKPTPPPKTSVVSGQYGRPSVVLTRHGEDQSRSTKTTLYIVPSGTIFNQWKESFQNCTTLDVRFVGNLRDVKNLPTITELYASDGPDALLISASFLWKYRTMECAYLMQREWCRIVVDEYNDTFSKVPAFKKYKFCWLLGASHRVGYSRREDTMIDVIPMLIGYKAHDYYGKWISTSEGEALTINCEEKFLLGSVSLPTPVYHEIRIPVLGELGLLRNMVPNLREYIDSGASVSLLRKLSPILKTVDGSLIDHFKSNFEKKISVFKARITMEENLRDNMGVDNENTIKNLKAKLEQEEKNLESTGKMINEAIVRDCPICMNSMADNNIVAFGCRHIFCVECALNVMKARDASCPLCRGNIKAIVKAGSGNPQDDSNVKTKHSECERIVKEAKGGVILYTHDYLLGTYLAKERFEKNGITVGYINNGTTCQKTVNGFWDGSIKVIILTGPNPLGINLHCASTVIIMEKCRDNILDQIVGRAQRIGRAEPLEIFTLRNQFE